MNVSTLNPRRGRFFNSTDQREVERLARQYGDHSEQVRAFIDELRSVDEIDHLTHQAVHQLVASELALPLPRGYAAA
ncbi:MAG: hypothetical protein ABGX87_16240 [Alcanivorax sp.]|uniref:Uncharacterized protein n=1 Tax=Alloalcanivorax marinus TaxID=1177169 RepID=A0A9Q3UMY8_9GAMM|nr:hypothetical protein [Alloalcanivorax marinus]MBM7333517.1 hypothetical protein [Alloalcanivorax marinus]MCC4309385.1 hypothetical protein [Alloalcanivorax marinus]MCU5786909.1 hypothetical protein [Alloalcanivorax marinus]